mgnify:CR=1 FL=1
MFQLLSAGILTAVAISFVSPQPAKAGSNNKASCEKTGKRWLPKPPHQVEREDLKEWCWVSKTSIVPRQGPGLKQCKAYCADDGSRDRKACSCQ